METLGRTGVLPEASPKEFREENDMAVCINPGVPLDVERVYAITHRASPYMIDDVYDEVLRRWRNGEFEELYPRTSVVEEELACGTSWRLVFDPLLFRPTQWAQACRARFPSLYDPESGRFVNRKNFLREKAASAARDTPWGVWLGGTREEYVILLPSIALTRAVNGGGLSYMVTGLKMFGELIKKLDAPNISEVAKARVRKVVRDLAEAMMDWYLFCAGLPGCVPFDDGTLEEELNLRGGWEWKVYLKGLSNGFMRGRRAPSSVRTAVLKELVRAGHKRTIVERVI